MRRKLLITLIATVLVSISLVAGNLIAGNKPSLGLDLQGGASVTLEPKGDYDTVALDVAVEIIRARVDSIGVAEPEIIRQGSTVVINLPGVKDQQRALEIVGRTGEVLLNNRWSNNHGRRSNNHSRWRNNHGRRSNHNCCRCDHESAC